MGFTSPNFIAPKWLCIRLLLLLVLSVNAAFSGEVVTYLPGYDGELPFHLQTGYISVNHSELFYYFFESQGEPETDPLFFWFSGGPGCSSFNGVVFEIGPIQFDIDSYNGGLPRLLNYPYTWTETASFVFVDSPVGTGFSYSTSSDDWASSDTSSSQQAYHFVRKWLEEHPQYLHLRLFIGGDSYSGMIVPLITQKIVQGNDAGVKPHLNLAGYVVGSPVTDMYINSNSRIILAHRLALISDQLYQKMKVSCKEDYVYVHPNETACLAAISQYEKNVEEIWTNNILAPNCEFASRNPKGPLRLPSSPELSSDLWCWAFNYTLSYHWANDATVQEALHVRKGKVKYWERCNQTMSESYKFDVETVVEVHQWLSHRKLQVLVNGGDRDFVVPYVATDKWLKILNLTVSSKWRPWYVDDQVAGYTRKYDEKANGFRLTYATLKGAGHTAPEYSRKQCYEMFRRWIHFYPL